MNDVTMTIDGVAVATEATFDVTDPATGTWDVEIGVVLHPDRGAEDLHRRFAERLALLGGEDRCDVVGCRHEGIRGCPQSISSSGFVSTPLVVCLRCGVHRSVELRRGTVRRSGMRRPSGCSTTPISTSHVRRSKTTMQRTSR